MGFSAAWEGLGFGGGSWRGFGVPTCMGGHLRVLLGWGGGGDLEFLTVWGRLGIFIGGVGGDLGFPSA